MILCCLLPPGRCGAKSQTWDSIQSVFVKHDSAFCELLLCAHEIRGNSGSFVITETNIIIDIARWLENRKRQKGKRADFRNDPLICLTLFPSRILEWVITWLWRHGKEFDDHHDADVFGKELSMQNSSHLFQSFIKFVCQINEIGRVLSVAFLKIYIFI